METLAGLGTVLAVLLFALCIAVTCLVCTRPCQHCRHRQRQ